MTDNTTTPEPDGDNYRLPAVSIRAAYSVGDVTDTLTVDIDKWDGDPQVIVAVVAELAERRQGAGIRIATPDGEQQHPDNVRTLRTTATGEEARA